MARAFQDYQIRQYLLGELSAADEGALETAYFGDADLLARLEVARDDLADDYAASRLSPADREKFERRVLATPEGREQVAIARALQQAGVAAPAIPLRPVWRIDRRWLSAAAVVPLAIGVFLAWWILSDREQRGRSTDAIAQRTTPPEAARPTLPSGAAAPAPQTPSVDQPPPSAPAVPALRLATLILTADLDRSAGLPPTLLLSSGATHVDLVAPAAGLTPGAARGRVETAEGASIWSGAMTVPAADGSDPRARARVPVSVLPPGDYLLSIDQSGRADAVGAPRYYFRVRAR